MRARRRAHGRPTPRLAEGVYLAGDYVDADYPATLEAAVRSGIVAAHAVMSDLGHVGR